MGQSSCTSSIFGNWGFEALIFRRDELSGFQQVCRPLIPWSWPQRVCKSKTCNNGRYGFLPLSLIEADVATSGTVG